VLASIACTALVKISGDEMHLSNPAATVGGRNEQVWKRVK
jgi:hypothetical protein